MEPDEDLEDQPEQDSSRLVDTAFRVNRLMANPERVRHIRRPQQD